jgi:hypothetical protein
LRLPIAAVCVAAAFIVGSVNAFAYQSGRFGYDIGYLQCGSYSLPAAAPRTSQDSGLWNFARAGAVSSGTAAATAWWSVPRQAVPAGGDRTWFRASRPSFGIIGVDSGYPFMSAAHPGNPCLSQEYAASSNPGLYINTGYDPSYEDSNHTTADCLIDSAAIDAPEAQRRAWAVGCSEAKADYGYASSKGIVSAAAWWLDVEIANSWCGQHGVACDQSLNQYTIQGIIDTLNHIGAVPVGIYSNSSMWSAIVGTLPVTGASMDWVASGTSTARQAAGYCKSSYSFSGAPVSLVQFLSASTDWDYAC